MLRWSSGDEVVNEHFGRGTVLAYLGQRRYMVKFCEPHALAYTMRESELRDPPEVEAEDLVSRYAKSDPQTETGVASDEAAFPPVAPTGARTLERVQAWQSLEALRLGVVPSSGTIHYTVGRDAELERIRGLLGDAHGFLTVFGDYGSGKTHLLDATEYLAREADFATARMTIDPREIAIQNPARIWGALARRLEFRGEVGLESFLDHFVDSPAHATPDGERASGVFTPCVHVLRSHNGAVVARALNHVHAEKVDLDAYRRQLRMEGWTGGKPVHLPDYRTVGRVYVHLIGTLAAWTRDIGGRGLVVILDEVERVDTLSAEDRRWALEFQQHLASVTMPRDDLAFDVDALYAGGNHLLKRIPLEFEKNQPLIAICAMTPLDRAFGTFAQITQAESYALPLGPPEDRHMKELVARIAAIYSIAYPGFVAEASVLHRIVEDILDDRAMGDTSFRRAIRGTVARLDLVRLAKSP